MQHYRAHRDLIVGHNLIIPQGSIFSEHMLKKDAVTKLLDAGTISPVYAPPLAQLPGWDGRGGKAEQLRKIKVTTFEAFMSRSVEDLAAALKVKAETIEAWREEILTVHLKP